MMNKQLPGLLSMMLIFFATAAYSEVLVAEEFLQITDDTITEAIEQSVLLDSSVQGHRLDVSTRDGVVTLSGTVDNLLAKWRALQLAGRTRGVRSVVNQIEVNAPKIQDSLLRANVVRALEIDPATERGEIQVKVAEGIVTLRGAVQSQAERMLAERNAGGVRGVRDIKNELNVIVPMERSDEEIKEDIQAQLRNSAWIESPLLDVSVEDGHVTLSGNVASVAEHLRIRNAAWVAGVKSMQHSELKVSPLLPRDTKQRRPSEYADEEIHSAMAAALDIDPRVPDSVTATVQNRTVTLRGSVDTLRARRAAEDDAWNTVGVKDVINRIKVRPVTFPEDQDVRRTVRELLDVDPYVDRFDVHVSVRNNHVYLHGEVDTNFDKLRAEEVATRAPGVVFVTNRLKVDASPGTADEDIKAQIMRQLFWDVYLQVENIEVDVQDGVVTLRGEVGSYRTRGAAQDIALAAGAERVNNQLVVSD